MRPSGISQKIAEETIPGLNRNNISVGKKKKKEIPNDEVEMKIVSINENQGRLPNEKKNSRI